jgi:hypothetical protein
MNNLSANTQVNLSTTERDAITNPLAGMVIYNTTTNKLELFTGLVWEPLATGLGVESGLSFKGVTKTANGEGIYVLDAAEPTTFVLPTATGSGDRYLCTTINTVEQVTAQSYVVGGDTAVNGSDIVVPINTNSITILNNISFDSLSNLNDMILVSDYTYTSGSRPQVTVSDNVGTVIGIWDILPDNNVNVTGNPVVDSIAHTFSLKITTYVDPIAIKTNTSNLFGSGGNEPTVEFQLTTTASAGTRVKITGAALDKFNNEEADLYFYNDTVAYIVDSAVNKWNVARDYKHEVDKHTATANAHNTQVIDLTDIPSSYGLFGQILAVNSNTTGLEWVNPNAGTITKFRDLTDTPIAYGTSGQFLAMNAALTAMEWVNQPPAGITTAIGLTDTPVDYTTANIGDVLAINPAKTALEWKAKGVNVLTELLDVPDNFGAPGEVLAVNAASSAAIWVAASGGGGGATTLIALTDTPGVYGAAGQILATNATGTGTEWVNDNVGGGGGVTNLIALTDTPNSFGTSGQVLTVNVNTDAVEWSTPNPGITELITLTDTPASMGSSGQILAVNGAGTALEWATNVGGGGGVTNLIALTDTPSSFGTFGQVLTVNVNTNAVEWSTPEPILTELIELSDTPNSMGSTGEILAVNGAENGLEWVANAGGGGGATSLIELFDTPPTLGNPGEVLVVNSGGTSTDWALGLSAATNIIDGLFGYVNGAIPTDSRVILQIQPHLLTILSGSVNSKFYSVVAPSDTVIFTIIKEVFNNYGTPNVLGTVTFVANNNDGLLSFTSQQVIQPNDMLYLLSPNDTYGMQDLFINLYGYSVMPIHT